MSSVQAVPFPKREILLAAVKSKLQEFSGMVVTVRQLYYRLVAAGVIPNNFRSYKNLGAALTAWRRSGDISLEAFEDRTRSMEFHDQGNSDENAGDWMNSYLKAGIRAARNFDLKRWHNQPYRVIVAVEKQALEGPFAEVCRELDVDLAVCRGYPSLSFLNEISGTIGNEDNRTNVILYFGDLDPSGLDIPRAIEEDLTGFFGQKLEFKRPALTHEQVSEMNLIPAPVKMTDMRAAGFIAEHGTEVYELDAIEPRTLQQIIRDNVEAYFDTEIDETRQDTIKDAKTKIEKWLKDLDIEDFLRKISSQDKGNGGNDE
ncbi:MAG TPA: hypothetical protein VGS11_10855 [Candidatus Bathyarchaeia archaeon]|nr:hypothetical protein [Candidatus Bathyarchaeia archaeon]